MPVFNRQEYVSDAIYSILNQSFTDFEFIIVDDGSTDNSYSLISTFKDSRIKPIKLKENKGNYYARNLGMDRAVGKYICVMDSDDIALPERIQIQYNFMEENAHAGICGGYVKILGGDEIIKFPLEHEEIKVWLLSNIMMRHPTIFIRKEFLKKHMLRYDDSLRYAADYDFLVKAAHCFPMYNIPKILLEYRKHPDQISSSKAKEQYEVVQNVILKQLKYFELEEVNASDEQLHLSIMTKSFLGNSLDFTSLRKWAILLFSRNISTKKFDSTYLAVFLKTLLKYRYKHMQLIDSMQRKNLMNVTS